MSDAKRTMIAQAGTDLAGEFIAACDGVEWGRIRLSEPEMSTGGGALARQPMVLSMPDGSRGIVIGWVNVAERTAEIRDWVLVDEASRQRYGQGLFLNREAYEQPVQLIEYVLRRRHIEPRKVVPLRESEPIPMAPAPPPQTARLALPLILALALAGGVAAWLFLR